MKINALILVMFFITSCSTNRLQNEKLNLDLIIKNWKNSNIEYINKFSVDEKLSTIKKYIEFTSSKNSTGYKQRKEILSVISKEIDNKPFMIIETFDSENTNLFLLVNKKNKNLYKIIKKDRIWFIEKKEKVNYNKLVNNFNNLQFDFDCSSSYLFYTLITKFDSLGNGIETKINDKICKEQRFW